MAFVLSAVFDREDPEEAARRAEATGIEGAFNRAVDGARSAIRREADEAMASMKEAARAKADEMKQRAKEREWPDAEKILKGVVEMSSAATAMATHVDDRQRLGEVLPHPVLRLPNDPVIAELRFGLFGISTTR